MKSREESHKKREEKSKSEKVRRKKMQVHEKVEKSRNTVFFQCFVAPRGRKSRLAKAARAEVAGQMRNENLHAVVARSTFGSEECQKLTGSDHYFWKLRCLKSGSRCGTAIKPLARYVAVQKRRSSPKHAKACAWGCDILESSMQFPTV